MMLAVRVSRLSERFGRQRVLCADNEQPSANIDDIDRYAIQRTELLSRQHLGRWSDGPTLADKIEHRVNVFENRIDLVRYKDDRRPRTLAPLIDQTRNFTLMRQIERQ